MALVHFKDALGYLGFGIKQFSKSLQANIKAKKLMDKSKPLKTQEKKLEKMSEEAHMTTSSKLNQEHAGNSDSLHRSKV
jgi:hypothetical protein